MSKRSQQEAARAAMDALPFEDQFNVHLGRLVHATARFDHFIGLQLNWLGLYLAVDVSKYLEPTKVTLATRLERLQLLVKDAFQAAGPAAMAELDGWFASAASARALRNNYVHGRWGLPGKLAESPDGGPRVPLLAFIKLDWDMTPNQPDKSEYLTIDEFRKQVEDAVAVYNAFFALSEKYLAFVQRR